MLRVGFREILGRLDDCGLDPGEATDACTRTGDDHEQVPGRR
jgi:hypothetical protein